MDYITRPMDGHQKVPYQIYCAVTTGVLSPVTTKRTVEGRFVYRVRRSSTISYQCPIKVSD